MKIAIYSDERTGGTSLLNWISQELNYIKHNEPFSDKLEVLNYLENLKNNSVSKFVISEISNFFLEKKNLSQDLIEYINLNEINNIIEWELNFLKKFLKFDKIIILGRSDIIQSSISKIAHHYLSSEEKNIKNINGVLKKQYNETLLVKKYKKELKEIVDISFDYWIDCYLMSEFIENSIYVSYEGVYYQYDNSLEKLKNFLYIDEFKYLDMINMKYKEKNV